MAEDAQQERPKAPIELRSAEIADLKEAQRIVTVIVAPYEQPTPVMWRGEVWTEQFERSAWNGIEGRPNRVRANRAHDRGRTCGRAVKFNPADARGLISEVYLARTQLGDETLELCRDNCLSVSAGFGALPKDQMIDHRTKSRRIKTAYLDHISFVEDPAYPGAEVLEVRENELILPEAAEEELVAARSGPSIEDFMNDPIFLRANAYLNGR